MVDAAKKLNEVSSMKGLSRYFKQVAQSARSSDEENIDDFLGCVTLTLNVAALSCLFKCQRQLKQCFLAGFAVDGLRELVQSLRQNGEIESEREDPSPIVAGHSGGAFGGRGGQFDRCETTPGSHQAVR